MISKIKLFSARVFVALLGRQVAWLIQMLAKSQLSKNVLIRGVGYLPIQLIDVALGFNTLRFIARTSHRRPRLRTRSRIRNMRLRAFLYLAVDRSLQNLDGLFSPADFRVALINEKLDDNIQYTLAHQLFQGGKLKLACEAFQDLAQRSESTLPLERKLQLLRDTGISYFLLGQIASANLFWAEAGKLRRFILGEESGPIYRIVGSSWFAAIGHVAMLDFYAKYNKVYRGSEVRVVATADLSSVPGSQLCERLGETGIEFIDSDKLTLDYDRWAKKNAKRRWSQLTPAERFALIDDFWEFEFPDGQIWGYTHAADKIQKEWERQERPPLLSVTEGEKQFITRALGILGVPDGAWYVCLHVREPGFHKNWNALYPSMRDANIDDYLPAIDSIVKAGGWVIRMGDSSMKPLPRLDGVVDYAHSNLKTPRADILIPLGCRFFLGTNSGFATIPAIYGVRCVFSNWLPIGLPLWPTTDLMMPKLFWHENEKRYLTFEETFKSGLAFIQNWSDLPEGITLRDNSPEDIRALAEEALNNFGSLPTTDVSDARAIYSRTARNNHSYVGSTLATSFIASHRQVFLLETASKRNVPVDPVVS